MVLTVVCQIMKFIFSVRSLGSVAFRRAIDKQKRYHFNFFSVDLAEVTIVLLHIGYFR